MLTIYLPPFGSPVQFVPHLGYGPHPTAISSAAQTSLMRNGKSVLRRLVRLSGLATCGNAANQPDNPADTELVRLSGPATCDNAADQPDSSDLR
jgi:hypothetical protein